MWMLELHFLIVLFGKNLVSNISTKASKAPYMTKLALFGCKSGANLMHILLGIHPCVAKNQKIYTLLLKLTAHKF